MTKPEQEPVLWITLVGFVFIAILNWFAYNVGNYVGTEKACESVKMEWVKDRCMKVTREDVI